jgi:RNA 2',3'-cyclic 3'-phosphodiesterase
VSGDERHRIFCGLRLPSEVLDELEEWAAALADGGRVVPRANLHVTLAFLGHRPVGELAGICRELGAAAAAAGPIRLRASRYRETRSVGMLVLDDLAGAAGKLALDLDGRLERLGVYEPERREWLPHVTVLRFRERPRLQPDPPELGEFAPSDAAAFLSRLRPSGAQYEVLESFALGG